VLGKPSASFDSSERHGSLQVSVRVHDFAGIRIRINKADNRIYALGATSASGFAGCRSAVLGGPSVAQQPTSPPPAAVPASVSLPVPMPADLRIVPPAADIPPERAAFSGVWVGRWDNFLDTALAIKEITSSGVSAVYAWGVYPAWRINQAGWTNARGRFAGPGELHVQTATLVICRMRSDGKLDAEFGQGGPRAILTKVFPR
jgi:hypothetical protein